MTSSQLYQFIFISLNFTLSALIRSLVSVVFYLNPCASLVLLVCTIILLWLMLSTIWTTKILVYFFLLLLLPFLLLLASISPLVRWNPPLLFSFFYFDFSTSSPSLCFLKRFFNFPISNFKLLVKNVKYSRFVQESIYYTCGFTSPHLSFSYLISIFVFYIDWGVIGI